MSDVRVMEATRRLLTMPADIPEPDLMRAAVDLAVEITDSQLGYLHYLNDDQETIEFGVWTVGSSAQAPVVYDRDFPMARAGTWAEPVRTGRPQITNRLDPTGDRRGVPAEIRWRERHLGVATWESGLARLLMGVADADRPYTSEDADLVQLVSDAAWGMMVRRRRVMDAERRIGFLAQAHAGGDLTLWQWDPHTRRFRWDCLDPNSVHLDLTDGSTCAVPPGDHSRRDALDTVRDLATGLADPTPVNELIHVQTQAGRPRVYTAIGHWTDRAQGHGRVLAGALIDISVEEELERALHQARHDQLTGLLNRTALLEEIDHRLQSDDPEVSVIFIDLDGFKQVNDTHGHAVGDEVLRVCAHRISNSVRAGDLAARHGGDEFVIVAETNSKQSALALADHLRSAIAAPIEVRGQRCHLDASVGVAVASGRGPEAEHLIAKADQAMYRAKRDAERKVCLDSG